MKAMRILLVAPVERSGFGGGQARAASLLAASLAVDPRVDVRHVEVPHQEAVRSRGHACVLRARFYGAFLNALAAQRPEVVHFFSPCTAAGFLEKTALALGARLTGARVLINFRSDLRVAFASFRPALRRLLAWALRCFDGAICQSVAMKDFLSATDAFTGSRLFVVPNAVAPRALELTDVLLVKRFAERRLIFIGALVPHKHVGTLLEAAALLRERGWLRNPLDIVGGAPTTAQLAALVARRDALNLTEHAIFHGPRFGADKLAILDRAAVLVLASHIEGYPNVALEALQAGIPVVLSDTGAAADIAAAFGPAVRLVPPGSPVTVTDAVQSLTVEFGEYCTAARNAERVCARHYPEAIGAQMYEAYAATLV